MVTNRTGRIKRKNSNTYDVSQRTALAVSFRVTLPRRLRGRGILDIKAVHDKQMKLFEFFQSHTKQSCQQIKPLNLAQKNRSFRVQADVEK